MRSVQKFGNFMKSSTQPCEARAPMRSPNVRASKAGLERSNIEIQSHIQTAYRTWKQKNMVKDFRSISLKRPSWMLKRRVKIKARFVCMTHHALKIWFGITRQSNIGSFLWCIEVQHSFHEELCTLWTCNELCFLLCDFWFCDQKSLDSKSKMTPNDASGNKGTTWAQVHGSSYFVYLQKQTKGV